MTEHALSKIDSDTPLPEGGRLSLTVAISVYQGRATLSLVQRTAHAGRKDRYYPIGLLEVQEPPATYLEALKDVSKYTLEICERLILNKYE